MQINHLEYSYIDILTSLKSENFEFPLFKMTKEDELIPYITKKNNSHSIKNFLPDKLYNEFSPDNIVSINTMQDDLISQLRLHNITKSDLDIGEFIINNIDNKGFINDYANIKSQIIKQINVTGDEIDNVLSIIHTLEPAGIGTRNVTECLKAQINERSYDENIKNLLFKIIKSHLNDLYDNNLNYIKKKLKINDIKLIKLKEELSKLYPYPAILCNNTIKHNNNIIPIFEAIEGKDGFFNVLNLEDKYGIRLEKDKELIDCIIKNTDKSEKRKILGEKIKQIDIKIQCYNNRIETFNKLAGVIEKRQQGFFHGGKYKLNPLPVKEISEILMIHRSTIYRMLNNNYIYTPYGAHELMTLCPINVKGYSPDFYKGLIKKIQHQNRNISDEQISIKIAEILGKNIKNSIKRRTIAKYRNQIES